MLNEQTVKALRKIKDNTGNFIWQPSVSAGLPDTILNRPYVTSVYAPVYCEEISLEASLTKNITLYQLLGIFSEKDLDLRQRWASR